MVVSDKLKQNLLYLFVLLFTLGGCVANDGALSNEPAVKEPFYHTFITGQSVQGRPINCYVLGVGQQTTLIIATIHGNESAGTPLVNQCKEYLLANPKLLNGRRVVLLPVANPDGLANHTRFNANGVDLNRNFPSRNFRNAKRNGSRPLSQPESRVILNLIELYSPDRIISIHQPLNCIDYDGDAKELAQAMANVCDLPVKKLGGRPGSLGSYCGIDRKVPIITIELPKGAEKRGQEQLWDQYGRMMMQAILYPMLINDVES